MVARKKNRGQAAIELALILPFVIYLLFYMLNAYNTMHTSHVAMRYAAMSLFQRLNNRAQYFMDDAAGRLHRRGFMAVQYTDMEGKPPRRKIVTGPVEITNAVGICQGPNC